MSDEVQEIEEVLESPAKKRGRKKKQRKVKNLRNGNVEVCGVILGIGGELVISEQMAASEKNMMKLTHAIKIGMLKEV